MKNRILHLGIILFSTLGLNAQVSSTGEIMIESTSGQTLQLDLDQGAGLVTMTQKGPKDLWFGIGLNASSMAAGTDVIYVKGDELVDAHLLGFQPPATDGANDWTVVSNEVSGELRTVVATRALDSSDNDDDYDFDGQNFSIIWAQGEINANGTIGKHPDNRRGMSMAEFSPILGIDELFAAEFSMSPNPALDVVNIVLPQEITSGDITIVDYTGKQLSTAPINSFNMSLDVSGLQKGMYLVNFDTPVGNTSKKIAIR